MASIDLQWFAAEDEGRTEAPSEHKLSKARKEGRVAKSQELNGTIVYLLCVFVLILLAPWMERKLEEMTVFYFSRVTQEKVDNVQFAYVFMRYFLLLVLPFGAVGLIAGVVANIIQNRGFLFTTKTIEPKLDKILPKFGQYFKRTLFSFEGIFNIIKSILKVVFIAAIAFLFIRADLRTILDMLHTGGPLLATKQIGAMTAKLLIVSAVILLVIGIADYFVQRRQFREQMKMTKEEVKQEFKELEGDPEVKSHLDTAQKEMLRQNIPRAVKEADVVITNPTHFAVVLQWKEREFPEVTAKGEDLTAQTIKRLAAENNVPVVENRPVARGLYYEVEIGDMVPEEYLRVLATIYTQIGYLTKKQ